MELFNPSLELNPSLSFKLQVGVPLPPLSSDGGGNILMELQKHGCQLRWANGIKDEIINL